MGLFSSYAKTQVESYKERIEHLKRDHSSAKANHDRRMEGYKRNKNKNGIEQEKIFWAGVMKRYNYELEQLKKYLAQAKVDAKR